MVYSYFDPTSKNTSIATIVVLDSVRLAQEISNNLKYVYLGYWIANSKNMDCKSRGFPHLKLC